MHTGKKLGDAIAEAIRRKGVKRKEVADHFGIKEPSIATWISKGAIDKGKLPLLWLYFQDVADMTHWGLAPDDFACFGLAPAPQFAQSPPVYFDSPRRQRLRKLQELLDGLNDSGIDEIARYARFIAQDYPLQKTHEAS